MELVDPVVGRICSIVAFVREDRADCDALMTGAPSLKCLLFLIAKALRTEESVNRFTLSKIAMLTSNLYYIINISLCNSHRRET